MLKRFEIELVFLLHTLANSLIKKLFKLFAYINTHRTEWRKTNYNYQFNLMFSITFSYTPILDNKCNIILIYNVNAYINLYKLNLKLITFLNS